eukprot:gene8180-9739_t
MSIMMQNEAHLEGEDGGEKTAGRWTQEEHNMFLEGLKQHQKQWKLIAEMVKTRTVVQIRTHAQKYFQKLTKSNGGSWSKFDKSEDLQDHEGRTFANPNSTSRAGSFCNSEDSIDSHGTSAEGVDSDGDGGHSPRLVGMNVPKRPANMVRGTSLGAYEYNHYSPSGGTSCSNSALSSPNGSSNSGFSTKRAQPNVLKVKGELVRKRSRESLKSIAGALNTSVSAPSPKKNNAAIESLKSRSHDAEPNQARFYATHQPHSTNGNNHSQGYYHPAGYSSNGYMVGGYAAPVGPGPLSLPSDDLRMGLGLDLVPDFFFPSSGFPEDPTMYNPHQRTISNDTDLTNHTPQYFGMAFNSGYGLEGEHEIDDDNLLHLLDKIDWETDPPAESANQNGISTSYGGYSVFQRDNYSANHSPTDTSRPLSPVTDTASSVTSNNNMYHPPSTVAAPTSPHHSHRVHLNNPVVPFALANTKATAAASATHNSAANRVVHSTESVSSELSRLSADYAAQGTSAAVDNTAINTNTISTSNNTSNTTNNVNEVNATSLEPKHRLAFSSVINELKLVTKVAKINPHTTSTVTTAEEAAAADSGDETDHISLFDLFQHNNYTSSVGRLPPLRSLVQSALARGIITDTSTVGICIPPSTSTLIQENNSTTATATAATSSGMEFDDHEFDIASFMGDDFSAEDQLILSGGSVNAHSILSTSSGDHNIANSFGGYSIGSGVDSHMFVHNDKHGEASDLPVLSAAALLNHTMQPSAPSSGPNSRTATPSVVQRKRGRPRKNSMSVPAAPVSTPAATTAKSLLSGPALAHALSTQQYYTNTMHSNSGTSGNAENNSSRSSSADYVVPVNATVLQAYNAAIASTQNNNNSNSPGYNNGLNGYPLASRSYSNDAPSSYNFRTSPNSSHNNSNSSTIPNNSSNNPFHHPYSTYYPDIRQGLTRTMSSESDTMMANCFDPKLYDDEAYGMGMLEDFE